MINGMKETRLLYADSLDFQKKVHQRCCHDFLFDEHLVGSKAVVHAYHFGSSALPFLLDDLGCTGSEIDLLYCVPEHNCGTHYDIENAGVQCSRKGI